MRPSTTLPDGWRWVRFGDLVRQLKERVDPETAGLDRYVAGEHMDTDNLQIRRWGTIGEDYLGPAFNMRFGPGQVLYGSRRTYLRKVAVADFYGICANTTFIVESASDDLLSEFLPFVMTTEAFHRHSVEQSKGSVNPYINFKDLAWYEFPLPPVRVQATMAELLHAASTVAETYRVAATHARAEAIAIASSVFDQAPQRPLAEVAGVELGKKRDPKLLREGTPISYLRAANVKDSHFDLEDVLTMNFTTTEAEIFALRSGDVLVTEGCGSLDQVGACAVWGGQLPPPVAFQMTLLRLRARDQRDEPLLQHWCEYAFRSRKFSAVASGTSVFHLSAARVRKMGFPVLDEVRASRIVAKLDAAKAVSDSLSFAIERATAMAGGLRETLLGGLLDV